MRERIRAYLHQLSTTPEPAEQRNLSDSRRKERVLPCRVRLLPRQRHQRLRLHPHLRAC
jgi:hypothetical protein